jgi:hypothetical protein
MKNITSTIIAASVLMLVTALGPARAGWDSFRVGSFFLTAAAIPTSSAGQWSRLSSATWLGLHHGADLLDAKPSDVADGERHRPEHVEYHYWNMDGSLLADEKPTDPVDASKLLKYPVYEGSGPEWCFERCEANFDVLFVQKPNNSLFR